jgi:enterochelin esterase-like enzyme
MKKLFLLLSAAMMIVLQNGASAQTGTVQDELTMKSEILNMDRKYAIYLPPDYETSNRKYPVLYLLHGAGDDQSGWVQFGEVLHIADKAINEGKATPMIIVMPDANSVRRGYFNDLKGEYRYEDYFFNELIPFIEKIYRVRSEKRYRAISGLSMGGGGTFIYAMHHPELFAAACPLSGALRNSDDEATVKQMVERDASLNPEETLKYLRSLNPHWQINNATDDQKRALSSVRWYIDCGDDDFLYEGNSQIHIAMKKKEIPHEYRVRDGGHTWDYWRSALPTVLEFITKSFHQ